MWLPLWKAEQCRDNKSSWLSNSIRTASKIMKAVQLFRCSKISIS